MKMPRFRYVCLLSLAFLAGGCGGSSASLKSTPRTASGHAAIGTAPATTPPPVHRLKGVATVEPHALPPTLPTLTPLKPATIIPAAAYTATLLGTITDAKSHAPVVGAVVRVGSTNHVAKSDASGRYVLHFPAAVPEPVEVSARGYAEDLAMGAVSAHSRTRLDFRLTQLKAGVPVAPPPPISFGSP